MNSLQNIRSYGFQRPISEIFLSTALYQISFLLVLLINTVFAESNGVVLVYLPAGIVFICLLVFGWTAAVGLICSLIIKYTLLDSALNLSFIVLFSITTISFQLLFLNAVTKVLKLDRRLDGFTQYQLIILVVVFSIVHAASHFYVANKASPYSTQLYADMLISTFFGIVVCLFLVKLFMISIKKRLA